MNGADAYHRGRLTWVAFAALLSFGFLNAVLGPVLPYLRACEHISYVLAVLHQAAFAVGGGLAGVLATRTGEGLPRGTVIRAGLGLAALAGIAIGYGSALPVTVGAAFLVSLLGTSALVRLWAMLAELHGERRTLALAEGEFAVSLGGIAVPVAVSALAATELSWRFAFVAGAVLVGGALLCSAGVSVPPAGRRAVPDPVPSAGRGGAARWGVQWAPTLVIVVAVVGLEFSLSFWLPSYLADDVRIGRGTAVAMAAGLYAANLAGRFAAGRLARRWSARRLLALALTVCLVGLPLLLGATGAAAAVAGLTVTGAGIGATFPLASSLHVGVCRRTADAAMGEVFGAAAAGQLLCPLLAGALAQAGSLRVGLLLLPVLVIAAAAGLAIAGRAQHV
ncbi:MFS transporter [Streptomyces sp. RB6PN25]|uniref:MFS transporter n=1 Tax=Streptomyces humicola TaxID=2953240 RepID=A0ABT1PQM9_9ACTN|nr:MFS transporter [Streptomyces humicola]MCQ4079978.1 MFS transporter [Streptomyces humicola]